MLFQGCLKPLQQGFRYELVNTVVFLEEVSWIPAKHRGFRSETGPMGYLEQAKWWPSHNILLMRRLASTTTQYLLYLPDNAAVTCTYSHGAKVCIPPPPPPKSASTNPPPPPLHRPLYTAYFTR